MPVINEEYEGGDDILPTDFSELLDLPDNAFALSDDVFANSTAAAEGLQATCPVHPETLKYAGPLVKPCHHLTDLILSSCLCNGFMGDWDLPEVTAADPYVGLEEPDYGKFENVSTRMSQYRAQADFFDCSGYLNLCDPRNRVTTVARGD